MKRKQVHTKEDVTQTLESFEYQWKNIPKGEYLLSDPHFKERVADYICGEFGRSRQWFESKTVLDAGCGNGRWSYGFAALGCHVVAFDTSLSGCRNTLTNVKSVEVVCADINYIPLREATFDIVFCWGVLHHTEDKVMTFRSIGKMVNRGGMLHIYLYGHRSRRYIVWNRLISSLPISIRRRVVKLLTALVGHIPFSRKIIPFKKSEHSNFDAYSPKINDQSSVEEAIGWFEQEGFVSIERMYSPWDPRHISPDLFLQAVKK